MLTYRPDIDGLRAVAVVPVIFFHAAFPLFPGGYAGVDVFFVISGYLITGIILRERAQGRFSLPGFYERRVRRIFPALFLVLAATLPLAPALMLPDDLENYGQSLVATSLFANNVLLTLTSGYFALAAEFKPLLHTWSLGLEEQFYLVFPLLLMVLARPGTRYLPAALAALAAASLGWAQWQVAANPVAAYFGLLARGWELLSGAALACVLQGRPAPALPGRVREAGAAVGLLLLVGAFITLDRTSAVPGVPALAPVAGTLMIIAFADPAKGVGRALAWRPLVGVGLVSYSLYLWHQPLFAFARLYSVEEPPAAVYAAMIALASVLAIATWKFVELPVRRGRIGRTALFGLAFAASLVTAGIGYWIHVRSGFPERWNELAVPEGGRRLNAAYNERAYAFQADRFADTGAQKVLVSGHSFARDFINAGVENGYFAGSDLVYSNELPECLDSAADIPPRLRALVARADYLIFASRASTCLAQDLRVVRSVGAGHVVVVGTKNFGWNMNGVMRLPPHERKGYRARVLQDVRLYNEQVARELPPDVFVDVLGMLQDGNGRVPVFTPDGKFISQDGSHLTRPGAAFVGKVIFEHPLLRGLKGAADK
ncbi:acyltransferase family protein [Ramlibacter albus]|uniref:Acyltransferase n=1 Tax=Ramlibacter albus TaxID=2079448 RepID=A0A923M6M7_9BURK|nr:acyltransferase [Ramlibacter albus]MBC5764320.1 acyltransferase [Ramlibacter albus]